VRARAGARGAPPPRPPAEPKCDPVLGFFCPGVQPRLLAPVTPVEVCRGYVDDVAGPGRFEGGHAVPAGHQQAVHVVRKGVDSGGGMAFGRRGFSLDWLRWSRKFKKVPAAPVNHLPVRPNVRGQQQGAGGQKRQAKAAPAPGFQAVAGGSPCPPVPASWWGCEKDGSVLVCAPGGGGCA